MTQPVKRGHGGKKQYKPPRHLRCQLSLTSRVVNCKYNQGAEATLTRSFYLLLTMLKRILVLSYEFPPLGGGAAPVVAELCQALSQLDYQLDVVTMGYKDLPRYENLAANINVIRVPCFRKHKHICYTYEMLSYLISAFWACSKLIKQNNYQLIHCHFIFPTGLLAWWLNIKSHLPYILTAHGSDVPGYNPDRFTIQHRLFSPLWKKIALKAAALISPSQYLARLIKKNCSKLEPLVIPNGIWLKETENGLNQSVKKNKILVVCRLLPRKGVMTLLKVIKKGLPEGWYVEIVGEGPERNKLEQFVREFNLPVTFRGWLEKGSQELIAAYDEASVFILLSKQENFPIVLLEAMQAGCAIITANVGGCAEFVGQEGLLVNPDNTDEVYQALLECINNPHLRTELSLKVREKVKNFSWSKIASDYNALLVSIINKKLKANQ